MENKTTVGDSESESEEIFFGPIVKREIMSKLKYYNLNNEELLAPLEKYKDNDVLNDSLVKFYIESIFLNSSENKNNDVPNQSNVFTMTTGNINLLTESQLLKKYGSSESHSSQEIQTEVDSDVHATGNKSASVISLEIASDVSNNSFDDNSELNCTLEEIEMLMKFGENYMNENKTVLPVSEVECSAPTVKISPIKNKENVFISNIIENKSPSSFKIPSLRFKSTQKSPAYKNIVSPVAVYIKSSPRVPLVQNVAKESVRSGIFREINNKYDHDVENTQKTEIDLPACSYKPAIKTMLLSEEKEPTMPGNIRKLIKGPLTPQIIKHVKRLNNNTNSNQDVTILSDSNRSLQEVQAEVSVCVSKNAARTNRLQF